jgi:hypothetical protein
MSTPSRTRPTRRPADPRARERLREAQAAETAALAAVCAAKTKVAAAQARRTKALATAAGWVNEAATLLDAARADLAAVSGADRAALLLGIPKTELRRSLAAENSRAGAA